MSRLARALLLFAAGAGSPGCGGNPASADMAVGPSCSNGVRDGDESDVDCGGTKCHACDIGRACNGDTDCAVDLFLVCAQGHCANRPVDDSRLGDAGAPDSAAGSSGEPCAANQDCAPGLAAQESATCTLSTSSGGIQINWPGGACTSPCQVADTDAQTGINADCPGGHGACVDTGGSVGSCERACDANDPCRAGYSCFYASAFASGCEPSARSQCQPAMCSASGCKAGESCVRVGPDDVGQCVIRCNPFGQNCGASMACYAGSDCGTGHCDSTLGGGDGASCDGFDTECAAGLACHAEGATFACRAYCGGAANVQCKSGQSCTALSSTVATTVVGICAP